MSLQVLCEVLLVSLQVLWEVLLVSLQVLWEVLLVSLFVGALNLMKQSIDTCISDRVAYC